MPATIASPSPVRRYFRDIYYALQTIVVGLRITLRHYLARVITVQYPEAPPVLQPRYRGFHWFEIEKCIGCDLCAKACPVDCIYIEKTAARKIDKTSGIARGGALTRFAIDYAKCMLCALCIEPCPTECIHMGDVHDLSGYDRRSMTVEFTELAKDGLQTPIPLWMRHPEPPDWALERRRAWEQRGAPLREEMLKAMVESQPEKKPEPAGEKKAATAPATIAEKK